MGKFIGLLVVALLFIVLFFPRAIPRALRRLGRGLRGVGLVGREIASGEESPESPLARYEVQAGEIVLRRLEASTVRSDAPALQDAVATIGARIAAQAERRRIPYRFGVIDADEPNAFAVPGGTVLITRPLVELCAGDDDRLAGILGHEVAHIDRRHAILQLAARAAAKTSVTLLTLGRLALLRRLSGQMEELLVKGYSREKELEADATGAALSEHAGYDPRGLARLLESLAALERRTERPLGEVWRYFDSHPPLTERIERLRRRYGP